MGRIWCHRRQNGVKSVLVSSFPRSGTHFLISAIAIHFGFNEDRVMNIPMDGNDIEFLLATAKDDPRVIRKSHNMGPGNATIKVLQERYSMLCIIRDPRAVLASLWHYYNSAKLVNRFDSFDTFLSKPVQEFFAIERFSKIPPSELLRIHRSSWDNRDGVLTVSYESLITNFDRIMDQVGKFIGIQPVKPYSRPKLGQHLSVQPCRGLVDGWKDVLTLRQSQEVMRRFND